MNDTNNIKDGAKDGTKGVSNFRSTNSNSSLRLVPRDIVIIKEANEAVTSCYGFKEPYCRRKRTGNRLQPVEIIDKSYAD